MAFPLKAFQNLNLKLTAIESAKACPYDSVSDWDRALARLRGILSQVRVKIATCNLKVLSICIDWNLNFKFTMAWFKLSSES